MTADGKYLVFVVVCLALLLGICNLSVRSTPSPILSVKTYSDLVRFTIQDSIKELRVEIFSLAGEKLFDSGVVHNKILNWKTEGVGNPVLVGVYLYSATLKDSAGQVSKQVGKLVLARGQTTQSAQSITLPAVRDMADTQPLVPDEPTSSTVASKIQLKISANSLQYRGLRTFIGCCEHLSTSVLSFSLARPGYAVILLGETTVSELAEFGETVPNHKDNRLLLALMGRVPVKATAENGPIRIGDLLTSSSKPGYAMRCSDPKVCEGIVIGKALESLENGEGLILMLIMR